MAKRAQIEAVRPALTAIDQDVTAVEGAIDAVVSGVDKATDVLESGLEKVADVVPEVLDQSVHVAADVTKSGVRAFRNPKTIVVVLGISCVVAGAGLGVVAYKIAKKRLQKEYEEKLDQDLAEMREFYIRQAKAGKYSTPRSAAEAMLTNDAVETLEKYRAEQKARAEKAEEKPEPVGPRKIEYSKIVTNEQAKDEMRDNVVQLEETAERNIFVDGRPLVSDDWDAEAEEASRNRAFPYIISQEEFFENTFEHSQNTLTYYEGDEVLADEKDEMIHDPDMIIGEGNIRFGYGSREANNVYIRNEKMEADFEVVRSTGKYAEEVLGIRHSDERATRLRKARWGDDE